MIGDRTRAQLDISDKHAGHVIACVGGGSNVTGIFTAFLSDPHTRLYGTEAGGEGIDTNKHAATLTLGKKGIIRGVKTCIL